MDAPAQQREPAREAGADILAFYVFDFYIEGVAIAECRAYLFAVVADNDEDLLYA